MNKRDFFHSVLSTLLVNQVPMDEAIKLAKEATAVWESY